MKQLVHQTYLDSQKGGIEKADAKKAEEEKFEDDQIATEAANKSESPTDYPGLNYGVKLEMHFGFEESRLQAYLQEANTAYGPLKHVLKMIQRNFSLSNTWFLVNMGKHYRLGFNDIQPGDNPIDALSLYANIRQYKDEPLEMAIEICEQEKPDNPDDTESKKPVKPVSSECLAGVHF